MTGDRQRRKEVKGMDDQKSICEILTRIAECLERIEKARPVYDQDALQEALIAVLSSAHTPVEYK